MGLNKVDLLPEVRSIEWLYSRSKLLHLWLEILFRVNQDNDSYPFRGETIFLKPGQFISSARKLAASTNIDKDTVCDYLNMLESQKWIIRTNVGNLTLFTITKNSFAPGFNIEELSKNIPEGEAHKKIELSNSDTNSDTCLLNNKDEGYKNKISLKEKNLKFYDEIRQNKQFWEQTSEQFHKDEGFLREISESFFKELQTKEDFKTSSKGVKSHLYNWLRRYLEFNSNLNNSSQTKLSNIQNGKNTNDNRRGFDALPAQYDSSSDPKF